MIVGTTGRHHSSATRADLVVGVAFSAKRDGTARWRWHWSSRSVGALVVSLPKRARTVVVLGVQRGLLLLGENFESLELTQKSLCLLQRKYQGSRRHPILTITLQGSRNRIMTYVPITIWEDGPYVSFTIWWSVRKRTRLDVLYNQDRRLHVHQGAESCNFDFCGQYSLHYYVIFMHANDACSIYTRFFALACIKMA